MSEFYYYCKTCRTSDIEHGEHYDPEELKNLWAVRKELVKVYEAGIPMRLSDGVNFNRWASFFSRHMEHKVVLNTTNSCDFWCDLETPPELSPDLVTLRQLVAADGCRSDFRQCDPEIRRSVETILQPSLSAKNYSDSFGSCAVPSIREYRFKKECTARVLVYEEFVK